MNWCTMNNAQWTFQRYFHSCWNSNRQCVSNRHPHYQFQRPEINCNWSPAVWLLWLITTEPLHSAARYQTIQRTFQTHPDLYTTPRIEDALDSLAGSRWSSVLELRSGYYQIILAKEDKEKTAFLPVWTHAPRHYWSSSHIPASDGESHFWYAPPSHSLPQWHHCVQTHAWRTWEETVKSTGSSEKNVVSKSQLTNSSSFSLNLVL